MKQQAHNILRHDYFCAANSASGFYSLFGEIFSPEKIKSIYILKGGPGCGKSTTMKKIADKASKLGYMVENYYCSSSPTSLDGIIIPELSVAVLDGTAPHTVDPVYPAACETIINLGEAFDTNKASDASESIRELTKSKKNAYTKAYAYLSSCSGASEIIRDCQVNYLIENKLHRAVDRICSKIKISSDNTGKTTRVFTECHSCKGIYHLPTFEKNSRNKYFVKDFAGLSRVFFATLKDELIYRGADITVSLDVLEPEYITGIYIDSSGTSFTMYDDTYARELDRQQQPYKIINTARFCDNEKFKRQRIFYKYAEKSRKILLSGALRELERAGEAHDKIEKLYYDITDYSIIESKAKQLESLIFK